MRAACALALIATFVVAEVAHGDATNDAPADTATAPLDGGAPPDAASATEAPSAPPSTTPAPSTAPSSTTPPSTAPSSTIAPPPPKLANADARPTRLVRSPIFWVSLAVGAGVIAGVLVGVGLAASFQPRYALVTF
jgi:hypothetical protein